MNTATPPNAPLRPPFTRRSIVAALGAAAGLLGFAALPRLVRATPGDEPDPARQEGGRDAAIFGVDPLPNSDTPSRYMWVLRFAADDPEARGSRLGQGGERATLAYLPRWLAPEVIRRPQPQPEQVTYLPRRPESHWPATATIVRVWDASAVGACRLCRECRAFPSDGDMDYTCLVPVPVEAVGAGPMPSEVAAYWSQRYDGPLPPSDRAAAFCGGEDD